MERAGRSAQDAPAPLPRAPDSSSRDALPGSCARFPTRTRSGAQALARRAASRRARIAGKAPSASKFAFSGRPPRKPAAPSPRRVLRPSRRIFDPTRPESGAMALRCVTIHVCPLTYPTEQRGITRVARRAREKEPEQDALDAALQDLPPPEKAFVIALLRGKSVAESLPYSPSDTTIPALRLLGRPRVERALQRLAPLLAFDNAGASLAARLLRPYALRAKVDLLARGGSQGLAAARDLLDSAPREAPADARKARLKALQDRRKAAESPPEGGSGNGDYVNSRPLETGVRDE